MEQQQHQQNTNYNSLQQQQHNSEQKNVRKKAYVKIIEQPATKSLRFRYECERPTGGCVHGMNSKPGEKTYPTIEIVGYKGRAIVVVSCVTTDKPYRTHPNIVIGKEGCKKGVCTMAFNSDTMRIVFNNLGIQIVKRKDVDASLKDREDIRVDPFRSGYSHRYHPSSIDLNSLRLCFQVFTECEKTGQFIKPLAPIVSEPIYNKKSLANLFICRLCSCSSSVLGNTQIIMLCEKVTKDDISVRFFEEKNGEIIWEDYADFQHTDVYKQTAITFRTPPYYKQDISEPIKVFIQLLRPSDGMTSEPLPFEYMPIDTDHTDLRRKRKKTTDDKLHSILEQLLQHEPEQYAVQNNANSLNTQNIPPMQTETQEVPHPFDLHQVCPELYPLSQPCTNNTSYFDGPSDANQHWNMSTNHLHESYHNQPPVPHQEQQSYTHQQQHQQLPEYTSVETCHTQLTTCNYLTNGNFRVNENNNNENGNMNNNISHNNENGSTVSSLLNLDSEQLVYLNSDDQQMLHLNTGDLNISDLSIPI